MKSFLEMCKPGIVILVLLCALVGYSASFQVEESFSILKLIGFLFGVTLISSGSLALNQVQEWEIDSRMPRTSKRPIPRGAVTPGQGLYFATGLLVFGELFLFRVSALVGWLGLFTIVFYNFFYTMIWKPKNTFAAVPGAIPGAMPVVIGYAANNPEIFTRECLYLFLIMFLWQMPHFWSLSIRYSEDYEKGGIPVLSSQVPLNRVLFHIGLYTMVYVFLALVSPFFVPVSFVYFFAVIPFVIKIIWEFYKFTKNQSQKNWLPFFLWVNFSLLVFLIAPVIDKWSPMLTRI